MKHHVMRIAKVSLLTLTLFSAILGVGQVSVLTQHNDNARTGQNLNETVLNTSNVNQSSFGKLFWRTVDGFINAQPLYVPGLTIQGATHNVVYVATQHNSVYAFDADDPNASAPLWQVNLGTSVPSEDICIITGDTNPSDCPYYDISPEIGITATPVIDTTLTPGIIYVVTRTKNTSNSTYHDYLHALALTSGIEQLGGPVEITGQVSGTGTGSSGGTLTFNPTYHHQRPSLLLVNGVLYIAFGSVGDIGTWHGWVMSYNATNLQQEAIFSVTPNGDDGGIWSCGQGLVADAGGNVYTMTGNGDFTANTGGADYGDSFVKFSGSSLTVADYFTPYNQATLAADNTDLGSGGPMLMPGTSLLVGLGKDSIFRVVNSTDMGHYNSSVDDDVQEFSATNTPFFSSPIYWNSPNNGPVVYIWGKSDSLKAFKFTGSLFQTTPVSESTIQNSSGFSNAAALSLSANDNLTGTGIVWSSAPLSGVATGVPVLGVLRAFDATNLTTELWDSTQNLTRDNVGNYAKFNPPTIANGKVYVGSFSGQLQVYGLNPPPFQGIQFVQVVSATPQSTTATVNVAYSTAQTAGDLNVVIVGWNDSTATVKSVTDSAGNTYTLAIGPTTGTALSESIYYAKNIVGSSTNTVTVTFNQGAVLPDVRILEYSGVATSNPLDVSVGASGNSNIADSGFVTTTAANELIIGANTVNTGNIMAGAPFTIRTITSPNSDLAADQLVNVIGSYHSWAPLTVSGPWVMQTVTFLAAAGSPGIYSPVNSSTLSGTSAVFQWYGYTGAAAYWLDVGKEPGGNEYYQSGSLPISTLSQTVNSLPEDGSTVWARWYYKLSGTWQHIDYSYTAFGGSASKGTITSPAPGATLTGGSVTFSWTAGAGANAYWLDVGSTPGGNQYSQSGNLGNVLTTRVNGLPTNGTAVYATLYSQVNGVWLSNAYTYTAFGATGGAIATLTSPTPSGSTLPGSSVTFSWQAGTDTASNYWIDVGSSVGGNQYEQSGELPTSTTSVTVNNLPLNGNEVYVTLYSLVNGVWLNNRYNFNALNGSSCAATINSPTAGSTLGAYTQLFNWTAATGPGCAGVVTAYWLDAGTTANENFYYQSGNLGDVTSGTAYNIPPLANDGNPPPNWEVEMTLWNLIGGVWVASPEVGYCASGYTGYPTCSAIVEAKGGVRLRNASK